MNPASSRWARIFPAFPDPTASGFMMARVRFMFLFPPSRCCSWRSGFPGLIGALTLTSGGSLHFRPRVAEEELKGGFRSQEPHQFPSPDHGNLAYTLCSP